jgi:hypothetical protein
MEQLRCREGKRKASVSGRGKTLLNDHGKIRPMPWSHISIKDQVVNTFDFEVIRSLLQTHKSTIIVKRRLCTIHKPMGMTAIH